MRKRKLNFSLQKEKFAKLESKIPFLKAFQTCKNGEKVPFCLQQDSIKFEGFLSYDSSHRDFIRLKAKLQGEIELVCDLRGEEYLESLNQTIEFYLSNGKVSLDNEHFEEVVECENGSIDLEEILRGEL